MIKIDRNRIDRITKDINSKGVNWVENADLRKGYEMSTYNVNTELDEISSYEMAHYINHMDRWLHSRKSDNTRTYKRGEILFVDLGANNFKYEPSFTHPAIVLKNEFNSILVVPCSTKKFGNGYKDVIDAYRRDGFSKNTGIQVGALRWINKNRVISRTKSKASSRVLTEIDNKLLDYVPANKINKQKYDKLKEENEKLKAELSQLKQKLEEMDLK
ncbi:MAG: type II toxin-antitoxin system PemK/MazF family toxin [Clostridium sp.]|uniref:type II toxin-antitoxin system PemK/MazF family toxin n=1 Tax=Clostridium sp. TaxID=1506 RepID=UPI003EE5383B